MDHSLRTPAKSLNDFAPLTKDCILNTMHHYKQILGKSSLWYIEGLQDT